MGSPKDRGVSVTDGIAVRQPAPAQSVRIMTYNIHRWAGHDRRVDLDRLTDIIGRIFGLGEGSQTAIWKCGILVRIQSHAHRRTLADDLSH